MLAADCLCDLVADVVVDDDVADLLQQLGQ